MEMHIKKTDRTGLSSPHPHPSPPPTPPLGSSLFSEWVGGGGVSPGGGAAGGRHGTRATARLVLIRSVGPRGQGKGGSLRGTVRSNECQSTRIIHSRQRQTNTDIQPIRPTPPPPDPTTGNWRRLNWAGVGQLSMRPTRRAPIWKQTSRGNKMLSRGSLGGRPPRWGRGGGSPRGRRTSSRRSSPGGGGAIPGRGEEIQQRWKLTLKPK